MIKMLKMVCVKLKFGFFDTIKKNNLKTGIKSEKSQQIKSLQLFKRIAKYLDFTPTYP